MIIAFDEQAFKDYQEWATVNKKIFKKIGLIIVDISRSPYTGLGKPEPLKHDLSGYWSRRIDQENRLVYKVEKDTIFIISSKYHY
jgi:toxin YoeB